MVKVFYPFKTNAVIGGELFIEGVKEFENDQDGIAFAEMFYFKYEQITPEPKKKKGGVKDGSK